MSDGVCEDTVGEGGGLYDDPGMEYHGVNKSGRGRKLPWHCMASGAHPREAACVLPSGVRVMVRGWKWSGTN